MFLFFGRSGYSSKLLSYVILLRLLSILKYHTKHVHACLDYFRRQKKKKKNNNKINGNLFTIYINIVFIFRSKLILIINQLKVLLSLSLYMRYFLLLTLLLLYNGFSHLKYVFEKTIHDIVHV